MQKRERELLSLFSDLPLRTAAREKFVADLSLITNEVLENFGKDLVISIVLAGGWGRGETTILMDRYGVSRILSDYDVLVVLSQPVPDTRCMELRQKLSKKTGIRTEIGVWTHEAIAGLSNSIFTYELSHHKVIWGDTSALSRALPTINPCSIPLIEGSRLLFNRGSALLLDAVSYLKSPSSIDARINLLFSLIKMVLALGDAYLLVDGNYHWSGRTRYERVCQSNMSLEVKQWYEMAWKIKQGGDAIDLDNGPWNLCLDFLRVCSLYHLMFESKRIGRQLATWEEYARKTPRINLMKPWNYFRMIVSNIRLFGPPIHFPILSFWLCLIRLDRRLMAVLPLLLYSLEYSKEKYQNLLLASKLLNVAPGSGTRALEEGLMFLAEKYGGIWQEFFG